MFVQSRCFPDQVIFNRHLADIRRLLIDRIIPCFACIAVENNDFFSLSALLEKTDANCGTYDDVTPLHTACELGNLDMIKLLLAKGASPHKMNRFGHCPFYMAIKNRRWQAVKLLRMKEVTVNLHPMRITMEMIQAVQTRDYHLLHAWALSGVEMDSKDYDGRTVMHEAVYLRDKSMITKLLDYGATPLEKDVWGQTAMDNARNDTAIMALFDSLFTVCCPTKEAYLLYKANYAHRQKSSLFVSILINYSVFVTFFLTLLLFCICRRKINTLLLINNIK